MEGGVFSQNVNKGLSQNGKAILAIVITTTHCLHSASYLQESKCSRINRKCLGTEHDCKVITTKRDTVQGKHSSPYFVSHGESAIAACALSDRLVLSPWQLQVPENKSQNRRCHRFSTHTGGLWHLSSKTNGCNSLRMRPGLPNPPNSSRQRQ